MHTGINVEPDFPGLVPRFYEFAVAKLYGYKYFGDWQTLSREQRSDYIGHYFSDILIEGHRQETVQDKIKRDSKKRNK